MRIPLVMSLLQIGIAWFGGSLLWGQNLILVDSASTMEMGIVRMDVGGVVTRDMAVLVIGDSLFLPVLESARLFGLTIREAEVGRIMFFVDGNPLFDYDSLVLSYYIDGQRTAIAPELCRWFEGDLYLDWKSFCAVLDAPAAYDSHQLFIRIAPSPNLPVVAWARERSIGRINSLIAREELGDANAPYHRSLLGSPELHWRLGHQTHRTNGGVVGNRMTGELHLSGALFMGHVDVGVAGRSDDLSSGRSTWDLTHWRWRYDDPFGSLLTRIQAGRIVAADRSVIGISLSNRPLMPRRSHALFSYADRTAAGTVVQLVQRGSMIAQTIADSSGAFRVDIPIGYGTTAAQFRFQSPEGGIFEQELSWTAPVGIIPAGRIDYDLNAGVISSGDRELAGDLSLHAGISSRLTAHAFMSAYMPVAGSTTIARISSAVVKTSGWVGRSSRIVAGFDLASGAMNGRLDLGGHTGPGLSLVIDSVHLDGRSGGSASARIPLGTFRFDGGVRLWRNSEGIVDAATFGSLRAGFGNTGLNLSASLPRGFQHNNHGMRGLVIGLDAFTFPMPWLPVTAGLRWQPDLTIASEVSIAATAHIRGGRKIGFGTVIPMAAFDDAVYTLRLELPIGRVTPTITASTSGAYSSLSTTIEGATVVTSTGVTMLPIGMYGQCSIVLSAYNDGNGNGKRDKGEEVLGPIDAEIRQEGMAMKIVGGIIEGVQPHRQVDIEADAYAMATRGLFPTRPRIQLTTAPSMVIHVDVPYAKGRDVSGRVRVLVDSIPDRNAPSLLSALSASLVTEEGMNFEGEVFSDGSLYFAGIPNGAYTLRFDQRQLDARGLCVSGRPEVIIVDDETRSDPEATLIRCEL